MANGELKSVANRDVVHCESCTSDFCGISLRELDTNNDDDGAIEICLRIPLLPAISKDFLRNVEFIQRAISFL